MPVDLDLNLAAVLVMFLLCTVSASPSPFYCPLQKEEVDATLRGGGCRYALSLRVECLRKL